MKILIVSAEETLLETLAEEYHPFCEPSEIIQTTVEKAAGFIDNLLVRSQKHIDLLVCRAPLDTTDISRFKELVVSVRNSEDEYSNGNFRLNSIPIVLDSPPIFLETEFFLRARTSPIFSKTLARSTNVFHQGIAEVFDEWLNLLEADLDWLNLDRSFDFSRSKVPFLDSADTNILSMTFLKRQKPLSYLWVGDRFLDLDVKVSGLADLMKRSERNPRLRNEKEIHKFLLENSALLLGQDFRKLHYERHFYFPDSKKYVEPDFINEIHNWSVFSNEVFEVKLPNRPFKRFSREGLTSYAKQSIAQMAGKYGRFFSDPGKLKEIEKRTGIRVPCPNFQFTLLMGRNEDLEENEHLIQKELGKYSAHILIQSYDFLIDRYERLFDRLKRFNILDF